MPGAIPLVGLLRVLVRHEAELVVVGGVAAVLNGAARDDHRPRHPSSPDALVELDAYFRTDSRRIRPTVSHLGGPGRARMATSLGVFDALGTIEANTTYKDVLADTFVLEINGLAIRTLGLARLIRAKEAAGRPKDFAVLPVLRATLAERGDDPE